MEPEQFQRETIERLQKLERKSFGGTKEEHYGTYREQAKAISDGKTKPHHIGPKTPQILQQELNSHIQSERETFTAQEKKQWQEKKQFLIDQLREATKN